MRRAPFQTTSALMMTVIVVIAVALAGLRTASDLAASAVFTAALGVTGLAIAGALGVPRGRRAGWAGFAVLSSGYLVLAFGPWFISEVRPHLITTPLLDWIYLQIHRKSVMPRGLSHPMAYVFSGGSNRPYQIETADHFAAARGAGLQMNHERIGHSIAALLSGLIGSLLGRWISTRQPDLFSAPPPERRIDGPTEPSA